MLIGSFDIRADTNWSCADAGLNGLFCEADALEQGGEFVKQCGRRRAVRVTGGIVTGPMLFKRLVGGVFDEDGTVRCAASGEDANRILDDR
jgi:hypothetical protein